MKVWVPSALHAYTGESRIEADGATLGELLDDLERRYPGIRFRLVDEQGRIRRHLRFFLDGVQLDGLSQVLAGGDEVVVVLALSGG